MKKLTLCAVAACSILLVAVGAQAENIKNLSSTDSNGINNFTTDTWTDVTGGSGTCSNGVVMPKAIEPNTKLTDNVITIPRTSIGGADCHTLYENKRGLRVTVSVGFDLKTGKFTTTSDDYNLAEPEDYGFNMLFSAGNK